MRKRLAKLPSPAMAVAFVALLAALTGTAVALPGSNTVTSGDIRNGQVKTQDIRNSTVRGRDVRNNTLTGSDINEGSLGTVPRATSAGSANTSVFTSFAGAAGNAAAVGGEVVERLDSNVGPSSTATIYSRNGLTLSIDCDSSGFTTLNATTSVNNADLYLWGYDTDSLNGSASGITGDDDEDGAFDIGDTVDITSEVGNGDGDTAIGQLEYFQPGVTNGVSVHYVINSFAGGSPFDDCQVSGTAIG